MSIQINIESTHDRVYGNNKAQRQIPYRTRLISWVNAREWHASYTGHRRPRLLARGDRHCRVHPQFFLQSFIGRQNIIPFPHHEQELL